MAGWLASCLSFMVSARLSCSSIISACSNNLKQHSTEFTREPCTQISSEVPRLTKGVNCARGKGGGGGEQLAARSGTELTWSSPQLRNLSEWDWVQIFLQNNYGGECRHGRTTSFCPVLCFQASKHEEKVSFNSFNGPFGHQQAWCMNSSWVTSLIVIRNRGKFS